MSDQVDRNIRNQLNKLVPATSKLGRVRAYWFALVILLVGLSYFGGALYKAQWILASIVLLIVTLALFKEAPMLFVRERDRRASRSTQPAYVRAKKWDGKNPLFLNVPKQGFASTFNENSDFEEWVERHASLMNLLLETLEKEDTSPAFLKAWVEWQKTELKQCIAELRNREHATAALHIEGLVEGGHLFQLETSAGRFVLHPGEDHTLGLRMLAATMFFQIPDEVDQAVPKTATERKYELFLWRPDLQANGETRVLYELSLNSSRALSEINQKIREIEHLKSRLEQALQNANATLELKPAANRWQRSARMSSLLALIGLLPFLLLLIGVPLAVYLNWQEVSAIVSAVFYAEDEKTKAAIELWTKFFTDAPWATFVFVTVPVLLFAWTLKHFSRIFVQNMNLASDAGRRAALADVYTRIVSDPNLNQDSNRITDEQKKIIFEAMFRPRDARHTDNGIDHGPVDKLIENVKGKD